MKIKQIESSYIIRLEIGEELAESLEKFVREYDIKGGWITGLGGATKAQIGYYNLNRKKYVFRAIKDVRELVSLTGNISRIGDEVALHLHGVVTDSNNRPRGGHIKSLTVGGTCEVRIDILPEMNRKVDPDIGLPLLDL